MRGEHAPCGTSSANCRTRGPFSLIRERICICTAKSLVPVARLVTSRCWSPRLKPCEQAWRNCSHCCDKAEASSVSSWLRPVQVPVQEVESAAAVDFVAAVEKLDSRTLAESQAIVEPAHLGVFIGYPLIWGHDVLVAALDHERPRHHQGGQLGVVERVAHIEIRHLPFDCEHETVFRIGRCYFPGPVVEVGRTDR